MSLSRVEGLPGAPWDRPLAGMLDRITVHSELLEGNPLGDPARRPLYVYRSPGVERGGPRKVPVIYVIMGFTGQVDMWLGRSAFRPTLVERLDAMFAADECPDAIVAFVDTWTRRGGSQYLNSSGTGRSRPRTTATSRPVSAESPSVMTRRSPSVVSSVP